MKSAVLVDKSLKYSKIIPKIYLFDFMSFLACSDSTIEAYSFTNLTDSSRGLKCKTFCKMCSCKNSAKNLQKFCRFFCKIFATFLQLFCNFFAIFLQLFCNFFATFLQSFFKNFFKKRKELEVMNLSFNSLF